METLWGLLTIELGSAFCRQYGNAGEPVFEIWSKDLEQFSEKELVQGLDSFKNSGSSYMSLNIFRGQCKKRLEKVGHSTTYLQTQAQQAKIHSGLTEESRTKGKQTLTDLLSKNGSRRYTE